MSRQQGRRVAKKNAIEKPNIESLAKAAKSLGLHPILEKNSAHPSVHWKRNGRLLVDKKDSKNNILNKISNRL